MGYSNAGLETGIKTGLSMGGRGFKLEAQIGYSNIPMQFDNEYYNNKSNFGGWFYLLIFAFPIDLKL